MRIGSGRTVVFKRGEEAWFLETGVVGLRKGPSWSVLGSWYSRQALGFLGGGGRCSGGGWFGDPPRRPEWPGALVSRRLGGGKWEMIHAPAGDGAWIVGCDRPGCWAAKGWASPGIGMAMLVWRGTAWLWIAFLSRSNRHLALRAGPTQGTVLGMEDGCDSRAGFVFSGKATQTTGRPCCALRTRGGQPIESSTCRRHLIAGDPLSPGGRHRPRPRAPPGGSSQGRTQWPETNPWKNLISPFSRANVIRRRHPRSRARPARGGLLLKVSLGHRQTTVFVGQYDPHPTQDLDCDRQGSSTGHYGGSHDCAWGWPVAGAPMRPVSMWPLRFGSRQTCRTLDTLGLQSNTSFN